MFFCIALPMASAKKAYTLAQLQESYRVLGISETSTMDEVQRAKRTLMVKWQPEINAGSSAAEEAFKGVSEAFYIIKEVRDGSAVVVGTRATPPPPPRAEPKTKETWISKFTKEMDRSSVRDLTKIRSRYLSQGRTATDFLLIAGYDTRDPIAQEYFIHRHFDYFSSLKPSVGECARMAAFSSSDSLQDRILLLSKKMGAGSGEILSVLENVKVASWQKRDQAGFHRFLGKVMDRSTTQSDFLRAAKLLGDGSNPEVLRLVDEHLEAYSHLAVDPALESEFQEWLATKDSPAYVGVVRDRLKSLRISFLRDMENCAKAYGAFR